MNVLVLGSGGREHALSWKISQDNLCESLYIAPGNAGTGSVGTNVELNPEDFAAVADFIREKEIGMVVVGPEAPLVKGIRNYLEGQQDLSELLIIGPGKAGAELEGSKDFAKEFMRKHNIPTAAYKTFNSSQVDDAKKYLESISSPYVLKADGLAAGKGVLILDSLDEAKTEIENMLANAKFGEASSKVVIEEFLDGIELSVFALTDGSDYALLPNAKDYKRIGEGDTGLNTGGMGAVSPVPFADDSFMKKIEEKIVKPTVDGLKADGIPYVGFIFFGLIKVQNDPYVIEYNVRMGDPETEVVMPRIKSPFLELLIKAGKGELSDARLELDNQFATTVMMVSGSYPESYEKGKEIEGLDEVGDSVVFHAGTKSSGGKILTSGGRVLAATGMGSTMKEALDKSYRAVDQIRFEKSFVRRDIGKDLI